MALLVELDHAAAKRLYERAGFCMDYTKRIAGQETFTWCRVCDAPKASGPRFEAGRISRVTAIIADADPGFNGLAQSPEACDYSFN
jgi:hypothetical protein